MDTSTDNAQPEPNVQDELATRALPLREAAEVLGLSVDATRKRITRKLLPARKVDGLWYVEVPLTSHVRPAPPHTGGDLQNRTTSSPPLSSLPAVDPTEHARILERLAGVEVQLAQTREDRDHWRRHATSLLERYDRDMQEMRALLVREQAIALAGTTGSNPAGDVIEHQPSPANDPESAPTTQPQSWWRRLLGG
jgi:hypothetical protein